MLIRYENYMALGDVLIEVKTALYIWLNSSPAVLVSQHVPRPLMLYNHTALQYNHVRMYNINVVIFKELILQARTKLINYIQIMPSKIIILFMFPLCSHIVFQYII